MMKEKRTDWVQIRSRRDPAFWAPLLVTVIITTALFLWAQAYTTEFFETINSNTLSADQTANQLILHVRIVVWSFSAILIIFSALNFRCFKVGIQEGRLPPTGWWSLGAWRAIVGPRVKRIAPFGYAISLLLFITAFGLAIAVEYFLLQAGRV
jgi:hypothetical protein